MSRILSVLLCGKALTCASVAVIACMQAHGSQMPLYINGGSLMMILVIMAGLHLDKLAPMWKLACLLVPIAWALCLLWMPLNELEALIQRTPHTAQAVRVSYLMGGMAHAEILRNDPRWLCWLAVHVVLVYLLGDGAALVGRCNDFTLLLLPLYNACLPFAFGCMARQMLHELCPKPRHEDTRRVHGDLEEAPRSTFGTHAPSARLLQTVQRQMVLAASTLQRKHAALPSRGVQRVVESPLGPTSRFNRRSASNAPLGAVPSPPASPGPLWQPRKSAISKMRCHMAEWPTEGGGMGGGRATSLPVDDLPESDEGDVADRRLVCLLPGPKVAVQHETMPPPWWPPPSSRANAPDGLACTEVVSIDSDLSSSTTVPQMRRDLSSSTTVPQRQQPADPATETLCDNSANTARPHCARGLFQREARFRAEVLAATSRLGTDSTAAGLATDTVASAPAAPASPPSPRIVCGHSSEAATCGFAAADTVGAVAAGAARASRNLHIARVAMFAAQAAARGVQ